MIFLPKFRPRNNDAVEPFDLDETLVDLWGEIDGNLDEHAFTEGAFRIQDTILGSQDDAIFSAAEQAVEDTSNNEDGTSTGDTWDVVRDDTFRVVGGVLNPFEYTFQDFPGGQAYILAAFQVAQAEDSIEAFRLQFCLEIDGSLLQETVTGTAEPENDLNFSIGEYKALYEGNAGIRFPQAVLIDAVIPLSPGTHTARVLASQTQSLDGDGAVQVKNRQIIVLVMHADGRLVG